MALQKLLLVAVLLLGPAGNFPLPSTPASQPAGPPPARYDVVVYGATAAGVVAAIAAAREGTSVLLIEPGRHLGGMLTGGLSHTDYGDRAVIGGMALEFYERVAKAYQKPLYFWRGPEPTLGEKILGDWLKEAKVTVRFEGRIKSVTKEGARIGSIQLLDGSTYAAGVFVDAGYEGDLMARAGVSYTIGRESKKQYGESWAGRQPIYPDNHNFHRPVNPFVNRKNGALLPLIHDRPQAEIGEADSAVQAYCFRLLMTREPGNMVPISRPERYDSSRFELLRRYLKVRKPATLGETGVFGPWVNLPNGKAEINSGGPISTNLYDGSNWAYPDADYPQRDRIWNDHLHYTHSLLYFMGHDPSVPENIRAEARQWGLCGDEFADTGGWPHQLYIRVGRRMLGEYVMTQHDLEQSTTKYDAIGMGSYNIDVRHVQRTWQWISRFPELHGETFNEGYLSIPVPPYEIPYRSLLPRYEECTNLIVPVCVSASHLAYASVRMEPQYMLMGHAAGVAAAMTARHGVAVQRIDLTALQKKLASQRQLLTLAGNPNGVFGQGNTVVVDDDMSRFVEKEGNWYASEDPALGRHAITFLLNESAEPSRVTYRPWLPKAGAYKVYGWWPKGVKLAPDVPLSVTHSGGTASLLLNQQRDGDGWVLLGKFPFTAGSGSSLTLSNRGATGAVAADAFKFEWIK